MELKDLINFLEIREKEAIAFLGYYKDKVDIDDLQLAVDEVCNNMAESFIQKYKEKLNDSNLKLNLRRYLCSVGADKKYSGKRVHEALFKKLNKLEKEKTL